MVEERLVEHEMQTLRQRAASRCQCTTAAIRTDHLTCTDQVHKSPDSEQFVIAASTIMASTMGYVDSVAVVTLTVTFLTGTAVCWPCGSVTDVQLIFDRLPMQRVRGFSAITV